jgi:hypothetical protein
VQTGSATNPEVRGIPAAQVASAVTGARSASNTAGSIPAARHTASKDAAKAASSTDANPSGPNDRSADSKATRTAVTNASSFSRLTSSPGNSTSIRSGFVTANEPATLAGANAWNVS